jgi:hypothetical protein
MRPSSITVSGSLADLSTVADVRGLSQRHFGGIQWESAAKRIARRAGGFRVLLADGRLRIFTLLADGRVAVSTWNATDWSF